MRKPKSEYRIQTVANALRVLEAFKDVEILGVTELARCLELHKNNVFRLLATLEDQGYVEQCANERYRLGVRCLELGQSYLRNRSLVGRARPHLEALARGVGETTHLAVLRGWEVVHLAGEQPSAHVLSMLRVGERLPAHATALGKVLLGCAGAAMLEAYDREVVQQEGLVGFTPSTVVDRHKLYDQLRNVASHGYAVDLEEFSPGLCCVAAPVWDAASRIVAALSISGPSFRLDADSIHAGPLATLLSAADGLSRELGYGS